MSLTDLPNELLLMVVHRVHPDDLQNFAVTNLRILCLAQSALNEHANLKAKSSNVVIEPSEVSKVLRNACWLPYKNSLFIKTVTLTSWPKCAIDEADADLVRRIIWAIARRTNFLPLEWVAGWICEILAGNAGAANAFILASLPNIQNLTMGGNSKDFRRIKTMVRRIVDAQLDPKLPQGLTRLSKLTISYARTGDLQTLTKFVPFFELPSFRVFSAAELHINFSSAESLKPRSSELSSLQLYRSTYTTEGMIALLECPKALRKFVFSPYSGGIVRAQFLCSQLERNAADTLEELSIIENRPHDYIGSLQGFKMLKVIIVGLDAFRNDKKMPRLVDVLPPSTKMVELKGKIRDVEEIDLFTSFSSLKASHLPNLTLVRVVDNAKMVTGTYMQRDEFPFWYARLQHGLHGISCTNHRGEWEFVGKRATESTEDVDYWLPEVCEFSEEWQDLWKSITGSRAARVKPDGDLLKMGFTRRGCGQAQTKMP